MKELIERIEMYAQRESFIGNDLQLMYNLYHKYIDTTKADKFCLSCPGSVRLFLTKFRNQKDNMISLVIAEHEKIQEEYGKE